MISEHLDRITRLQDAGELSRAADDARAVLQREGGSLSAGDRSALEYEIERSRRIARDYSLSREELLGLLREGIAGFEDGELDAWIAGGRLDFLPIDGEPRFVGPSRANLLFRFPEIRARAAPPVSAAESRFLLDHARRVSKEAAGNPRGMGRPRRFTVTMSIHVLPGRVARGETIRCWMPFPREEEFQRGVELLSAAPVPLHVNDARAPHRALYFEQASRGDEETVFRATWRMEVRPRWFNLKEARGAGRAGGPFTGEQPPHVAFSGRLIRLAEEIVGGAGEPAARARRIYDWIGAHLRYSFAREYSTLRNIPEGVLERGCGDCGQIALLFITLCRIAGVPARWQSGWVLFPFKRNLHDWAEIHLEPHGWVPVDPDYAMAVRQHHDGLRPEEKAALADFYFGGLDAYRMMINGDHGQPLVPPKEDFRSDPVDFQRGELEAGGRNLYFDCFRYRLSVDYVDPPDGGGSAGPGTPGLTAPGSAR